MSPHIPILVVGLVILGVRLAEVYGPPLITWLIERGLDLWEYRERKEAPPEPPLPRSPRFLPPSPHRRRSTCTDEEPRLPEG
jgi:hypothetical protein